jgi:septal ring factor EnvC (AmiA/AmiB activator)
MTGNRAYRRSKEGKRDELHTRIKALNIQVAQLTERLKTAESNVEKFKKEIERLTRELAGLKNPTT